MEKWRGPHTRKSMWIQRIATKMVQVLEKSQEMNLITLKKGERWFNYIIHMMNNLEETDRKDLILRRKGEARNFRGHKKNCKMEFACTIQKSTGLIFGLLTTRYLVTFVMQINIRYLFRSPQIVMPLNYRNYFFFF